MLPLLFALEGGGAGLVERQRAAVAIWTLIALGVVSGLLPRVRVTAAGRAVLGLFAALFAFAALGLLWTESVERTVGELARISLLGGVTTLTLLAVGARTWRAAAGGLLAATTTVAFVALLSRLTPDLIDWGSRASLGMERLNFPLEYWNALAFVAVAAILLALAHGVFARERVVRVLALASIPLSALVLYLTLSRGGLAALTLGLVVLLALTPQRRRLLSVAAPCALAAVALILVVRAVPAIRDGTGGDGAGLVALAALVASSFCGWLAPASRRISSRRDAGGDWIPLAVGGLAVLVFVAATIYVGDGRASQSEAGPNAQTADPAERLLSADSPRYELWAAALDELGDAPLAALGGSGAGTYAYAWDESGRGDELVVDSHSVFMDALAETGIIGLLLLAALLLALGCGAWIARGAAERSSSRAVLAALFAVFAAFCLHAGVDWLWEVPATAALALIAACAALASTARPRPRERASWKAIGSTLVVAVAGMGVAVPGLVTSDRIDASRDALRAGQLDRAQDLADEAVDAAPWFASPRAQRAEVELASGDTDAASADAAGAIEREPREWRHAFLAARVDLAVGESAAAIRELERAAGLRPGLEPLTDSLIGAIEDGNERALDGFAPR